MLNYALIAAEEAKANNLSWAVDIFTFIGIVVCIITAAIALVWLTCFVVKLLIKTFGAKVGESYDVFVEDMKKKAENKKARNAKKREEKDAQKLELLNMKLESKARVHEMKKQKLQAKLEANENAQKEKLSGTVVEKEEEPKVEEVQTEQPEEEQKEKKTSKSKKKEENA
ncbi:MAG: hypothetical protein IJ310_02445 [Clostridia bacterium]|nr:hypothetical protein [Clostridia bacterium]